MSTHHDLWPLPPSQEGFAKLLDDMHQARREDRRRRFREIVRSLLFCAALILPGVLMVAAAFFAFAITVGTL